MTKAAKKRRWPKILIVLVLSGAGLGLMAYSSDKFRAKAERFWREQGESYRVEMVKSSGPAEAEEPLPYRYIGGVMI